VLASSHAAVAQQSVDYASISGRVTDRSGAVLPGARIIVRHVETNLTSVAVTGQDGRFRIPYLKVGAYEITATWPSPTGRLTGTTRVQYRGENVDVRLPIRRGQAKITGHVLMQETGGGSRPVTGAEVAIGPKVSYFARSGPDGALLLPEVYP